VIVPATFNPDSSVAWDFGDGDIAAETRRHTGRSGSYRAEVFILDTAGNQTRIVRDPPMPGRRSADPQDARHALAVGG
jgi:hypothetical protein